MAKFDRFRDKYLNLQIRVIFNEIRPYKKKTLQTNDKIKLKSHVKDLIIAYNDLYIFYAEFKLNIDFQLTYYMADRADRALNKLKKAFEIASIQYELPSRPCKINIKNLNF